MQHNFVFQLIFYPSQDKFSKFQTSRISENSLRMLPNIDVNLSLVQLQTSENSLQMLPNTDANLLLIQTQGS